MPGIFRFRIFEFDRDAMELPRNGVPYQPPTQSLQSLNFGNFSARRSFWLDAQLVIDGVHDPLPGAEVPFRGLYRPMSKQELNLLKLSTG